MKAIQFVVVFAAFALCNEIGYYFLVENKVSIFYPATAVDVLACMHFGWVGALAVFLAYVATPWDPGYSASFLVVGGLLNVLHGAIPAVVFHYRKRLHTDLRDFRSFGAFLFFGAILNSAVFALLGTILLIPPAGGVWDTRSLLIWWVSDFSGVLLIGAPLLAWGAPLFDRLKDERNRRSPRTLVNALEVSAAILLLGWIASTAIRTNVVDSFEDERVQEQQTSARAGRLLTIMQRNLLDVTASRDATDRALQVKAAHIRHHRFVDNLQREGAELPPALRRIVDEAARESTSWLERMREGEIPDAERRAIDLRMLALRAAMDAENENRWRDFAERRDRIELVSLIMDVLLFSILGLAAWDLFGGISRPLAQMHKGIIALRDGALFDAKRVNAGFVEIQELADTLDGTSRALRERERELMVQTDRALSASRHKSDFLAKMSHELRTPLNSIMGFSELMMERTDLDPEKRRGFLENIWRSGSYLLRLINDLLDIARIESGKVSLQIEQVDLRQVVRNAVVSTSPLFSRKKQDVQVALGDSALLVRCDGRRIEQVVLNLLANANKYSGEGAGIEVSAGETEAGCEIAVRDSGFGIDASDHERIFDEFEQAAPVGSAAEGSGLGLALAKRFVEAHGGRITVESEPGRGSLFRVILPRDPTVAP